MWAIRSSSRSNSSGESEAQKRAILRAISTRAAATASAFLLSFIRAKAFHRDRNLACRPRILALEQRILFLPAMDLVASGTFERVHLLDGQCPKGLRIHREACIDQFAGIRALDDDPVQLSLSSRQQQPSLQGKFRDQSSLLVASFFAGLMNRRTGMCHPARRVWMLSLWTPARSGV